MDSCFTCAAAEGPPGSELALALALSLPCPCPGALPRCPFLPFSGKSAEYREMLEGVARKEPGRWPLL